MMTAESNTDVNAKHNVLRTKASANGGDGKFMTASALHGCDCYFNNCRGHRAGFGCSKCMRKYANGETLIDCGPGVCGFAPASDARCIIPLQKSPTIAPLLAYDAPILVRHTLPLLDQTQSDVV